MAHSGCLDDSIAPERERAKSRPAGDTAVRRSKRKIEAAARRLRLVEENSLGRIVSEAKRLSQDLHLLLVPPVLTGLLKGKSVDLEAEVRRLARDPLEAPGRHRKRFGDTARASQTLSDTHRTYELVLAISRELKPLAGRQASKAEKREALLTAGVPKDRLERVLDTVMPVQIPRLGGGLRDASFKVAARSLRCSTRTAENRFKAWPKLLALLDEASVTELRQVFIQERRRAFRTSWLGQARLRHLRAKRQRLQRRRQRLLAARRRGQLRALKATLN